MGPGGAIGEVRLTQEAMHTSASALSAVITATIREALSSAAVTKTPQAPPGPAPTPRAPARRGQDHDEPMDTVFDV